MLLGIGQAPEATVGGVSGFVRRAGPGDGVWVASVQAAAWAAGYAALLPDETQLDRDVARTVWETAAVAPPTPEHRLFVAYEGADRDQVVGFAAVVPDGDPDLAADPNLRVGQLLALHVHPEHTGQGHGSRLVAAAVDHATTYEWDGLTTWVLDGDTILSTWLAGAGWTDDGARRTLDDTVGEQRFRVWVD
jgi:GNAT superfamily N-acetyltransferase